MAANRSVALSAAGAPPAGIGQQQRQQACDGQQPAVALTADGGDMQRDLGAAPTGWEIMLPLGRMSPDLAATRSAASLRRDDRLVDGWRGLLVLGENFAMDQAPSMPPLDFDIDSKHAAIRMTADRILVLTAFACVYVVVAFFIGTYSLSEILVNAAVILGVGSFAAVCISLPAVNNAILSIHNGEAATRNARVNCRELRVIPFSRGVFGVWLKDGEGRRYYFPSLWHIK